MIGWNRVAIFVGGLLAGTAGVSILSSSDAKKVYTHCTAAAMRGSEKVMEVTESIRENCDDIKAEAANINEQRKAETKIKEVEKAKAVIEAYEEKLKNEK